jgi:hypothetical protein
MYKIRHLTLPGGFQLPVCLIIEQYQNYVCQKDNTNDAHRHEWIYDLSESYLRDHMVAGQIVSSNYDINAEEDCLKLRGSYICLEIIQRSLFVKW